MHLSFHLTCVSDTVEDFWNGILPRCKEILEYLLTTRIKKTGSHGVDHSQEVPIKVKLHWIYCNVYPVTANAIKRKIDNMFTEYTYLVKMPNEKKKETYEQLKMFDILADSENIQEKE